MIIANIQVVIFTRVLSDVTSGGNWVRGAWELCIIPYRYMHVNKHQYTFQLEHYSIQNKNSKQNNYQTAELMIPILLRYHGEKVRQ